LRPDFAAAPNSFRTLNLAQGLQGRRTDLERPPPMPSHDFSLLRLLQASARLADVLVVALIFTILA